MIIKHNYIFKAKISGKILIHIYAIVITLVINL